MVPVVIVGGDERSHRGEHLAPDAQLFQPLGIVVGQGGELAGAVVHHPHLHAGGGFPGQDLQHPAPHEALVHDEIFQEDEVLGGFQLPQHLLELVLAQGEIGHVGAAEDGVAAALADVPGQRRRPCAGRFQLLLGPRRGGHQVVGLLQHGLDPFFQRPVAHVALDVQKEQGAEDRQQQDHRQPGELGGGVDAAVEQVEHHDQGEEDAAAIDMGQEIPKPEEDAQQEEYLHQQQGQDQPHPAEQEPHDALLPFFQQGQARVFFCSVHGLVPRDPAAAPPFFVCSSIPQGTRRGNGG